MNRGARPVAITYGTRPGSVSIDAPGREPLIIWDKADAMRLAMDLCHAMHRAWPDAPQDVYPW
jgi:hypothetical protein